MYPYGLNSQRNPYGPKLSLSLRSYVISLTIQNQDNHKENTFWISWTLFHMIPLYWLLKIPKEPECKSTKKDQLLRWIKKCLKTFQVSMILILTSSHNKRKMILFARYANMLSWMVKTLLTLNATGISAIVIALLIIKDQVWLEMVNTNAQWDALKYS